MSDSLNQAIEKAIDGLLSKTIRLEARCDALEIACATVARKAGIDDQKLLKSISDLTEYSFQKRLERIESVAPSIAADIDYRPSMPDLPDELS